MAVLQDLSAAFNTISQGLLLNHLATMGLEDHLVVGSPSWSEDMGWGLLLDIMVFAL